MTRAFVLRVWGFPADAVAELRRALATDPSYPNLIATVRLVERIVRDPARPVNPLEDPGLDF